MRRRIALILASSLLAVGVFVQPAAAGKPILEHEVFEELGVHDDFLTEVCGFDVWFDIRGNNTFRTWTDADGNPTHEVHSFGIRWRFYSETASVVFPDVGADRVTYLEDGSIIRVIIGNVQSVSVPGEGRVYAEVGVTVVQITFDDEGEPTFEVIRQSGQHYGDQLEAICAALD